MGHITSYLIGGLAAVTSWSMVAPGDPGSTPQPLSAAFHSPASTDAAGSAVNRAAKGDRLGPIQPGEKQAVATIEVVGVNDATIIYRDRNGNMLYRTDPMNNVTVIAKGVKLPDITVRQTNQSAVTPMPVEVPGKSGNKSGTESGDKTRMPVGCESPVSPYVSPELSHLTGRCISQASPSIQVASAIN